MRTVLIANRKGGCGKTVTAITLASAFAAEGARVALADADRQKSALRWLRKRPAAAAPILALDWTGEGFGTAPKKLDWLIIDAPGALRGGTSASLVAEADALVTPVLPAVFDAESTQRFLGDIEELKRVRRGKVAVHLVANRVRAGARAEARLRQVFAALGQEPVAIVAERTAYADLAAAGLGLFDRQTKSARALQAQWLPLIAALQDRGT